MALNFIRKIDVEIASQNNWKVMEVFVGLAKLTRYISAPSRTKKKLKQRPFSSSRSDAHLTRVRSLLADNSDSARAAAGRRLKTLPAFAKNLTRVRERKTFDELAVVNHIARCSFGRIKLAKINKSAPARNGTAVSFVPRVSSFSRALPATARSARYELFS
ncbi:hypothetical protein EVAR_14079_1 [Eumeta japonica]|uniref:Uncharacterized protein n=1 Tax=Eumeta variegata TaxID=151549 RepID=A0A4C1UNV9_EUMVA|nr:hypothetical protein EVAR_14079_1 [Eumeta japonica]